MGYEWKFGVQDGILGRGVVIWPALLALIAMRS